MMKNNTASIYFLFVFFVSLVTLSTCPPPDAPKTAFDNEYDMLYAYITAGYCYETILSFIRVYHACHWSIAKLKRKLKSYGLGHRLYRDSEAEVDAAILGELQGPRAHVGYRTMWRILRQNSGLSVSRNTVMERLRVLDPEGSRQRQSGKLHRRAYFCPGPNYTWHSDGYDKLKPWGFCIHGAIDGYSRKLLWLKVASTNNDPRVVAGYYVESVLRAEGSPRKLITDCGTENHIMATMNCVLHNSSDGHRYVTSVRNQRIESWWSYFRKNFGHWWMCFFQDLYESGTYDPDQPFHKHCMQYCLMAILQYHLDCALELWNSHNIRPSKAPCPSGIPNEMYYLPQQYNAQDYLLPVSHASITNLANQTHVSSKPVCGDQLVANYVDMFRRRRGMNMPATPTEAIELFKVVCESAL